MHTDFLISLPGSTSQYSSLLANASKSKSRSHMERAVILTLYNQNMVAICLRMKGGSRRWVFGPLNWLGGGGIGGKPVTRDRVDPFAGGVGER